MAHDVKEPRLQSLNDADIRNSRYVLYWMQRSQRAGCNIALEYAVAEAAERNLPLLVAFVLTDDYPEANERHYAFMLEGLVDVRENLKERGISFVTKRGSPPQIISNLAQEAALVVCDRAYQRHLRSWRKTVAEESPCRVFQIEQDVVVPAELVSEKREYAARTIRPKIHEHWERFLVLPEVSKHTPRRFDDIDSDFDLDDIDAVLSDLKIDRSVKRSKHFTGGRSAALDRLEYFVDEILSGYLDKRSDPSLDHTSHLSPYLHFGHISPVEAAVTARDSGAPKHDIDAFLEELIVRRELSVNYVLYEPAYDSYDALPDWARKTLSEHADDEREYVYSTTDLETATTHDPFWNAAQKEMTATGYMHNYMRMYWGKKILEWSDSPREAFERTLHLNNKYFIDGRDPNSFVGVAWIYGLHDRGWTERDVFGKIRYMNANGLRRKFDIDAYVTRIAEL